jgi:hypothetical protein
MNAERNLEIIGAQSPASPPRGAREACTFRGTSSLSLCRDDECSRSIIWPAGSFCYMASSGSLPHISALLVMLHGFTAPQSSDDVRPTRFHVKASG